MIGFRSLKSVPCVYVYEDENGSAILTLYMDDIILLGANKQMLYKLKKQLIDRFEMTDMGDVSRVLGMKITCGREEGTITINQNDYTEDIVQRYGIATPRTPQEGGLNCLWINQRRTSRTKKTSGDNNQSRVRLRTLHRSSATTSSTPSTIIVGGGNVQAIYGSHGAAKHLLSYLAGSTGFSITYKQGGFKLTAISDGKPRQREVCIIIHHRDFQRPDQLQGWAFKG